MLLLHAIACAVLVVNVSAKGVSFRPDFFHPLRGLAMPLEPNVQEHGRREGDIPPELWFEQKLDHFTPSNTEVFSQRYVENKASYGNNSLVFLLIGEDNIMLEQFITYSFMGDEAKKWRAASFMLEHRYHGKSVPKGNFKTENLKYLTSKQALADVTYFITQMNIQHGFKNPKWIVFGWSYGGSLATWMRYKYPHLVYAAVGSTYFQEVTKAYAKVDPKCVDVIRDAFRSMSDGMKDETKRKHYTEHFKLCTPLEDNKNDIAQLYLRLAYEFAYVVLGRELIPFPGIDIEGACKVMTDDKVKCPYFEKEKQNNGPLLGINQVLERTAQALDLGYCTGRRIKKESELVASQRKPKFSTPGKTHKKRGKEVDDFDAKAIRRHIYGYYRDKNVPTLDKLLKSLAEADLYKSSRSALHRLLQELVRQVYYQSCTETGWYHHTSSGKSDMFGGRIPIDFFANICKDAFDSRFNVSFMESAANETNMNYGGIPDVSRVMYVFGEWDPWRSVSIKEPPKGSVAIYIKGVGHRSDIFPTSVYSLTQVKKAHDKMSRVLQKWTTGKEQRPEEKSIFYFKETSNFRAKIEHR
ncbi:unnamed protein product [Bemisia tabaci]|uniref:Serine protease K12H4.7 n=1 Tax=Bemisia tabaci TaxID=7038 RepID=A0A9P0EX57_BEMTA|nr:unnamed protein product [Bemisia tabaci]